MLLCDVGNTSYHFLDDKKDYKKSTESFNPKSITKTVYYICVNHDIKNVLKDLDNWIDLATYIDMDNYYETMGIDRIFASQAVDNGIIIDAGSAITVDVVKNSVFSGGFIYPGIEAMSKTYKEISKALDYKFNFDVNLNILPKNSQDAISYGYLKTLQSEVISLDMQIYLTGGDADKFVNIFKDAIVDKTLIFKAMRKYIVK